MSSHSTGTSNCINIKQHMCKSMIPTSTYAITIILQLHTISQFFHYVVVLAAAVIVTVTATITVLLLLSAHADRQSEDISFTVCLCVFVRLRISPAMIKLVAANFAVVHQRPGRGISHFGELCSPRSPKLDKYEPSIAFRPRLTHVRAVDVCVVFLLYNT